MKFVTPLLAQLLLGVILWNCCFADEPTASKLRTLSPDRPDVTESPISVDKGHIQLEASFLEWARDGGDDDTYRLPALNIKYGLTDSSDIQLVLNALDRITSGSRTSSEYGNESGVRYKHNFFGNDDGDMALGILVGVLNPSWQGRAKQYRPEQFISLVGAYALTESISLAAMSQVTNFYQDSERHYERAMLQTVSLGTPLFGNFDGYIELAAEKQLDYGEKWAGVYSTGMLYNVEENFQLDIGSQFALSDNANDSLIFTGFTIRW